jgi:hypothetical protein
VTYTLVLNTGLTQINLNWSGSSGNPITYDGSTWGSGTRAIITGGNEPDGRAFTDNGTARSNLTFKGFEITDIGGYAEDDPIWDTTDPVIKPPGGAGIHLIGGGSNLIVIDCYMHEVGQWQNQIPMSGTGSVTGTGVSLRDVDNVLVSGCEFTRMKTGVGIKANTTINNVRVVNCSFHNYMNWLIDVAPRAAEATLSNITVDRCTFYDYKEFDEPNWEGYGGKPHQDGIFFRTSGSRSYWSNVVVKNCLFYSDDTSNGGTASIFISQGPSVTIYNCLFLEDKHSNAYVNVGFGKMSSMADLTVTVRVLNCTFVGGTRNLKFTPNLDWPVDVAEVRNNIFYRTTAARTVNTVTMDRTIGDLTMDNNLFYSDYDPPEDHYDIFDGGYRTLASWQTFGYDLSSEVANPDLMSLSGSPSTWDADPKASSPAMNFGALLSEIPGLDKIKRARGFPWGRGALYPKHNIRPSWPVAEKMTKTGGISS